MSSLKIRLTKVQLNLLQFLSDLFHIYVPGAEYLELESYPKSILKVKPLPPHWSFGSPGRYCPLYSNYFSEVPILSPALQQHLRPLGLLSGHVGHCTFSRSASPLLLSNTLWLTWTPQ